MQSANTKSAGKMVVLGIQHVFAMFGSTVLVPILTGLDPAMALLCAGLGTLIFHLVTGGKVPAFLGSSFAFIAAICTVAADASGNAALGSAEYMEGLRYACGGIIVAGALYLVLAGLVMLFGADKIRSFFPPLVTGAIIIIIGLMLAPTAISNITTATNPATGASEALTGGALWINWLIAAITIGAMFFVSIRGRGFFKLVPILIGIAVGYCAALICQLLGANVFGSPLVDFSKLTTSSWIQLPHFMGPLFSWKAILTIAPLSIVTFVEHVGDMQANGAVVGRDFIKDPGLHRTLLGDGLATMVAGALGGPANTTYSENTGVLAATRNYKPHHAADCGGVCDNNSVLRQDIGVPADAARGGHGRHIDNTVRHDSGGGPAHAGRESGRLQVQPQPDDNRGYDGAGPGRRGDKHIAGLKRYDTVLRRGAGGNSWHSAQ